MNRREAARARTLRAPNVKAWGECTPAQRVAASYVAGVFQADGWCGPRVAGLQAADLDFLEAFRDAMKALGFTFAIGQNQGYFRASASNQSGRFSWLRQCAPETPEEKAAWARAFFDSDGNAQWNKSASGTTRVRRVAVYTSDAVEVATMQSYLAANGIACRAPRIQKPSTGHLGRKTMFVLALVSSRENYARFLSRIGTSIGRKRASIEAIVDSYVADLSAAARRAQAKGAATRAARAAARRAEWLPEVVAEIRRRIATGEPVTIRACASIPHFTAVYQRVRIPELRRLAGDPR